LVRLTQGARQKEKREVGPPHSVRSYLQQ